MARTVERPVYQWTESDIRALRDIHQQVDAMRLAANGTDGSNDEKINQLLAEASGKLLEARSWIGDGSTPDIASFPQRPAPISGHTQKVEAADFAQLLKDFRYRGLKGLADAPDHRVEPVIADPLRAAVEKIVEAAQLSSNKSAGDSITPPSVRSGGEKIPYSDPVDAGTLNRLTNDLIWTVNYSVPMRQPSSATGIEPPESFISKLRVRILRHAQVPKLSIVNIPASVPGEASQSELVAYMALARNAQARGLGIDPKLASTLAGRVERLADGFEEQGKMRVGALAGQAARAFRGLGEGKRSILDKAFARRSR